jgi:hypothetical protein
MRLGKLVARPLLARYFERTNAIVERRGGVVEKFRL